MNYPLNELKIKYIQIVKNANTSNNKMSTKISLMMV